MAPPRPFRFGVQCAGAGSRAEWVEKARKVEGLGYSSFLMPDHFGDQFAPLPALLAVATAAERLRICPFVLANDFRHPVVLAKEAATLDLLSDGRLELGLGAGWHRAEYEAAGIPFDPPGVRVARLSEAVRIIKGLFGDEPVTFTGQHYTVTDLEGSPRPAQRLGRPAPPLLLGGGGKRLLSLAAREADIISVVPQALADGTGLDVADGTAAATAEKISWVRRVAGDRFAGLELNILLQALVVTDDRRHAAEQVGARFKMATDGVLESVYVLVGTVDQIVATLRERRERYGISYVVVFEHQMDAFAPVVARLAAA